MITAAVIFLLVVIFVCLWYIAYAVEVVASAIDSCAGCRPDLKKSPQSDEC